MPFPDPRAYRLLTARLELRCYQPADAPELAEVTARNKAHLLPFMPWSTGEPQTVDEKLALIRKWRGGFDSGTEFVYRVQWREGPGLIAGCGLHGRPAGGVEIGYWVDGGHLRRGVATEMAAALTRFTIEHHRPARVEIRCQPDNAASNRIAEGLGFHRDGVLRRTLPWPGEEHRDVVVWSLLPDELAGSLAGRAAYEAFDDLGRRLEPPVADGPAGG